MKTKKRVLILNGQYLPGYKGGGPIQSCVNMVENLKNYYEFYVLTADRDYKEDKPYSNVKFNEWIDVAGAKVYYMSQDRQNLKGFQQILNSIDYDVMYLNGFFSPIFTIKPLILRLMGKLKNNNIILTPRGDFTGGCENKKLKKYGYIFFAKLIGLYKDLLWQATSNIEERDIKKFFRKAKIFMVPNLPTKFTPKASVTSKERGKLRLVFVSRIFPKKNIKYALEVLKQIKSGEVLFDIYGPMEDQEYWSQCEEVIRHMPNNVKVNYCGEVQHAYIPHIFEQYHAFFFPTLGENYGHVIVEAMMNNCLCILSKGVTPWDDYIEKLDIGANLCNQQKFVKIIERLIAMDSREMNQDLLFTVRYIQNKTKSDCMIKEYISFLGE